MDLTNAQFAARDKAFGFACEKAKVKPTRRQASKFRNGRGLAYKASKG
jgi:hypothetical protein